MIFPNFDQCSSGEKPCDFSLEENSPYLAPAATWDRIRDLPLFCAVSSIVPTLLPVRPQNGCAGAGLGDLGLSHVISGDNETFR